MSFSHSVSSVVTGKMVKATSIKDVDQHEAVKQIAHFLKKSGKVKVPEWSDIVKLGANRQLAPVDPDWYYIRTASIARRLYIRSPVGVGALRTVFGGKKDRGSRPNHFCKGSGSVIRKALQTLEAIKWVEKHADGKGRVLSKQVSMILTSFNYIDCFLYLLICCCGWLVDFNDLETANKGRILGGRSLLQLNVYH
ncbi:unnamed protein product [Cylicostephanus goldi]|uniref:Ribosomal protein S19e n=1 Tax=Cylicostephanus goldi TaxID=71465 RepID=A0A3P7N711_CYLGO|nr:unnamed protein product [Cylicostephanus goldi]